jgi:hypothetical protein
MRGRRLFFTAVAALLSSLTGVEGEGLPKTFATMGFAEARGGSGGQILRVTNLDAEGAGSLRAALAAKGARIIVFEVGGVVDLKQKALSVKEPYVTIAGQTAPSPGITLIRGSISINTHDVVVQHIRVRPGDAGAPKGKGWEPDGLCAAGAAAYNVIVDHCSLSWAVDENLSASGPRLEGPAATAHRVTFSNCIIAEGLSKSTHVKGEHSKGSLIHDFCQEIAVIGNLYAHNVQRNPYFKAHCTGVIVNNVIYDPGSAAIQLNYSQKEWDGARLAPTNCRVSIVGNVLIHGASTKKDLALVSKLGDAFMEDNLAFKADGAPAALTAGAIRMLKEKPVWPEGLLALPSGEVVEHVARHAGARPQDRDEVDLRIIRDFLARKGRVIDSQNEVGGYPKAEMVRRPLEIPPENVGVWLAEQASQLE